MSVVFFNISLVKTRKHWFTRWGVSPPRKRLHVKLQRPDHQVQIRLHYLLKLVCGTNKDVNVIGLPMRLTQRLQVHLQSRAPNHNARSTSRSNHVEEMPLNMRSMVLMVQAADALKNRTTPVFMQCQPPPKMIRASSGNTDREQRHSSR